MRKILFILIFIATTNASSGSIAINQNKLMSDSANFSQKAESSHQELDVACANLKKDCDIFENLMSILKDIKYELKDVDKEMNETGDNQAELITVKLNLEYDFQNTLNNINILKQRMQRRYEKVDFDWQCASEKISASYSHVLVIDESLYVTFDSGLVEVEHITDLKNSISDFKNNIFSFLFAVKNFINSNKFSTHEEGFVVINPLEHEDGFDWCD